MRIGAFFSAICFAAILLIAAALPSVASAHGSQEHAVATALAHQLAHAASTASLVSGCTTSGLQSYVSSGKSMNAALSGRPAMLDDVACDGACCGTGCCGGCTMALVEAVVPLPPLPVASRRIAPARNIAGPSTVPEALPKPPRSFA